MSEYKHNIGDLCQMQSLPLHSKIRMTEQRIEGWIDEFGEDGVYIAFSGGKDSTVLMDIIRNRMDLNIPAAFVDVPTQYPELKEFAKTWDNVEIIKPKISFMEVCEKYGFPLISKEVSECVYGARKYLTKLIEMEEADEQINIYIPYTHQFSKLTGTDEYAPKNKPKLREVAEALAINNREHEATERVQNLRGWRRNSKDLHGNCYTAMLTGQYEKDYKKKKEGNIENKSFDKSMFNQEKYKFFLDAPFEISQMCCSEMKKKPIHKYAKETGRLPITAQMAD